MQHLCANFACLSWCWFLQENSRPPPANKVWALNLRTTHTFEPHPYHCYLRSKCNLGVQLHIWKRHLPPSPSRFPLHQDILNSIWMYVTPGRGILGQQKDIARAQDTAIDVGGKASLQHIDSTEPATNCIACVFEPVVVSSKPTSGKNRTR